MRVVLLLGLPGSGKGTQAEKLVERFGFFHFDTGREIERAVYGPAFQDDPVIKRERAIFDSGVLNTPSWVEALVRSRIHQLAADERDIVFSGSPRTLPEAEGIIPFLEELYGRESLVPIVLNIPAEMSVARNSKRKICQNRVCVRVAAWDAPMDLAVCDACGGALGKRILDDPDVIRKRIVEYRIRTAPVLDFLRSRGIAIMEIDGTPKPEEVHKKIVWHFMRQSGFKKTGPMKLPSRIGGGTFDLYLYEFLSGNNYFVLQKGDIVGKDDVLVRIDSNCVWAGLFGSARCDCAEQMHEAMRRIIKQEEGLLIHAYNQDGRGLSLRDHVRVYIEQDKGFDTIEADRRCGFKNPDRRNYDEVLDILKDYQMTDLRLLTNNPHRVEFLEMSGVKVKREGIEAVELDKFNIAQLYMKKKALGHLFYSFNLEDPKIKQMFAESLKKWSHSEYDGYLWKC